MFALKIPLLLWLVFALHAPPAFASTYLYLIDTSSSMRVNRSLMIEAVTKDLERALATGTYADGDHIHVWTFDSKVSELKTYRFDAASPQNVSIPVQSELKKIKFEGRTSLARPLAKALSEFGPTETGHLIVFVYTDGRDAISQRDSDSLLRLARQHYNDTRLLRIHYVYFGPHELPRETRRLLSTIGGSIMLAQPSPAKPTAPPRPEKKETKIESIIAVAPTALHLTVAADEEIIRPLPIEFSVTPPQPGLLVDVGIEATNWPPAMSIETASERIATEGKQSVPIVLKNAVPGRYTALLKLSSVAPVTPREIPIDIEIVAPKPLEIGLRFFPEAPARVSVPLDNSWHSLPSVGMGLFYSDDLKETKVQFTCEAPEGVQIQLAPARPGVAPIDAGAAFKLGDLGSSATFRVRHSKPAQPGDAVARVTLQIAPGQNARFNGPQEFTVPLQFVAPPAPFEVQVETREISLGELFSGTATAKASVGLLVKGQPDGRKIRVLTQGTGLSDLTVAPAEIALTNGPMTVELIFGGLQQRRPGPIDGVLLLATPFSSSSERGVREVALVVRGTIKAPPKFVAELETPLVAGLPIVIRGRFDSPVQGNVQARVRIPGNSSEEEFKLEDSGSEAHGDTKAGDGIFSGVFRKTDQLGRYQITLSADETQGGKATQTLIAPVYFKGPEAALRGTIAQRKKDEFVELEATIASDAQSDVPVYLEPSPGGRLPIETYLSSKALKPGDNVVKLLVRLLPEAQAGPVSGRWSLVAELPQGAKAKIPVIAEIEVISFSQYFARLLGLGLGLGLILFLVVSRPWKRRAGREVEMTSSREAIPDEDLRSR